MASYNYMNGCSLAIDYIISHNSRCVKEKCVSGCDNTNEFKTCFWSWEVRLAHLLKFKSGRCHNTFKMRCDISSQSNSIFGWWQFFLQFYNNNYDNATSTIATFVLKTHYEWFADMLCLHAILESHWQRISLHHKTVQVEGLVQYLLNKGLPYLLPSSQLLRLKGGKFLIHSIQCSCINMTPGVAITYIQHISDKWRHSCFLQHPRWVDWLFDRSWFPFEHPSEPPLEG